MDNIEHRIGDPDNIAEIQLDIFNWGRYTFGHNEMAPRIRSVRLVEEALELAQTEGVTPDMLHNLINEVYSRPVGESVKELGGVLVTTLAYAEAKTLNSAYALDMEIERINSKPKTDFKERFAEKISKGFV